MAANSPDDWFVEFARPANPLRQLAQALHGQNIWKRSEIVLKRRLLFDRGSKVFDGYFARPRRQRIGFDFTETDRFKVLVDGHAAGPALVSEARPSGRARIG